MKTLLAILRRAFLMLNIFLAMIFVLCNIAIVGYMILVFLQFLVKYIPEHVIGWSCLSVLAVAFCLIPIKVVMMTYEISKDLFD